MVVAADVGERIAVWRSSKATYIRIPTRLRKITLVVAPLTIALMGLLTGLSVYILLKALGVIGNQPSTLFDAVVYGGGLFSVTLVGLYASIHSLLWETTGSETLRVARGLFERRLKFFGSERMTTFDPSRFGRIRFVQERYGARRTVPAHLSFEYDGHTRTIAYQISCEEAVGILHVLKDEGGLEVEFPT